MALRSLGRSAQTQIAAARRRRAVNQARRDFIRRGRLRARSQRLAYKRLLRRQQSVEWKRRVDTAQEERVRGHRAVLAARRLPAQASSPSPSPLPGRSGTDFLSSGR